MEGDSLFTTIHLRQYGQSPQLRIQGSKQAEWNLWPHCKWISLSPSVKDSKHIPQSCSTLDSDRVSLLLKTLTCKQSSASWVSPGGFWVGACKSWNLAIWDVKSLTIESTDSLDNSLSWSSSIESLSYCLKKPTPQKYVKFQTESKATADIQE
jgi:hypothetical protein